MLKIELEHNGLKLHGWITAPQGARQQGDLQYCYVNGRMMRDKLINHAIRQSYEMSLDANQFAAYVLFIEVDPQQVDVNVHPAKHEVRFHQARLVHDFIYQALSDALVQGAYIEPISVNEGAFHQDQGATGAQSALGAYERERQAIDSVPNYPGQEGKTQEVTQVREQGDWATSPPHSRQKGSDQYSVKSPQPNELKAYQQLLTVATDAEGSLENGEDNKIATPPNQVQSIGKAMHVVHGQYLVTADKLGTNIINLVKAEWLRNRGQLLFEEGLKSQPLLVPLAIKLDGDLLAVADEHRQLFVSFGLELRARGKESIIVMGVPNLLRQQNLQQLIPDLLTFSANQEAGTQASNKEELADWLSFQITRVKDSYTLSEAIQILADIELTWKDSLPLDDRTFVKPVDFLPTIATFTL
jgi:DNA mismatch repair protein MutL